MARVRLSTTVDRAYLKAYQEHPVETRDEWGHLASFLDAAAKR